MLLWILSALTLSSCVLNPPNEEICVKLISGARCFYTYQNKQRDMTDEEWNSVGRLSMSAESYGEFKKFIQEACQKSDCVVIIKQLEHIDRKIENAK